MADLGLQEIDLCLTRRINSMLRVTRRYVVN